MFQFVVAIVCSVIESSTASAECVNVLATNGDATTLSERFGYFNAMNCKHRVLVQRIGAVWCRYCHCVFCAIAASETTRAKL